MNIYVKRKRKLHVNISTSYVGKYESISSQKGRLRATKTSKLCGKICGMSSGPWVLGVSSKTSGLA